MRNTYVIATVETRNFTFQTLANTRTEADAQLLKAWRTHCRDYGGLPDRDMMRQLIADEEVNYTTISVGQSTRDGEVLK